MSSSIDHQWARSPFAVPAAKPIKSPHVGQIVHYWPLQCEKTHDHDQPFRADICHINANGTVNLIICNEVGIASRRTGVPILPIDTVKSGEASMFL